MKKEQTNLDLFDNDKNESYDTVTLNTENLFDVIKKNEYDVLEEDNQKHPTSMIHEQSIESSPLDAIQENINSVVAESLLEKKEELSDTFNIKKSIEEDESLNFDNVQNQDLSKQLSDQENFGKVKIMAIGIGGCGCNAIDRMQEEHFGDIELIAIDTSRQTLQNIKADKKFLIGESVFNGHGSGNDVDKATEAFIEAKDTIQSLLKGVDMVFITGGIGRGTGSAGLVEVGKYSREMGILTLGFATLPKIMEADLKVVEQYYDLFVDAVDSNVIVENDKVTKAAYNLPINQAMKMADQMLIDGIRGISDLIINPGKINLDYADIKTAFANQGSCIMGIGYGVGENLVVKAIDDAIDSDLINFESLKTAETIIFNVTCSKNTITIKDAAEGTNLIYSKNSSNDIQHMLFGYSYDEKLENKVKVTFIATGTGSINFEDYKTQNTNIDSFFTDSTSTDDLFTSIGGNLGDKPDFF